MISHRTKLILCPFINYNTLLHRNRFIKMPLFSSHSSPKRISNRFNPTYEGLSVPEASLSVNLSCLSPDSSTIFSLSHNTGIITNYFLPFRDTDGHDGPFQAKIKTKLPDYITQSLDIDPPLEIICVDNFTVEGHKQSHGKCRLPLLCLYNCKAAYVLSISYNVSECADSKEDIEGYVDAVIEPFENHLLSSESIRILRIRAAPQSCIFGGGVYETLNPRGAMVMLTNEHSLLVHHGIGHSSSLSHLNAGYVSVPFSFSTEDIEGRDSIVDFTFLPSSPKGVSSIFNAMTVALVTNRGSIYLASPILFHGTVLPSQDVYASISHLECLLKESPLDGHQVPSLEGAYWRRNRAALQFLTDAFGSPTQASETNYYLTSKIFEGGTRCGTNWPVTVQGPLCDADVFYDKDEDQYEDDYTCISTLSVRCMETMTTTVSDGSLAGILLSGCHNRSGHFIHFIMIPAGTAIIPRFFFESKHDADALNHSMRNSAVIADRVVIDIEQEQKDEQMSNSIDSDFVIVSKSVGRRESLGHCRDISILPDPVNKRMLHHVSRYGVYTIVSDAFDEMSRKILSSLEGDRLRPTNIKVNAWPSMEIVLDKKGETAQGVLSGAVVIGDAQFGHILAAMLSKGSFEILNLSAAQYLHEAYTQVSVTQQKAKDDSEQLRDDALKAMESIPPLYELLSPLFQQITVAVSNMSKVVGGTTSPKDISAGGVANFLEMKESCGKNIVFPLIEVNGLIQSRLQYLQDIHSHQELQMSQLNDKIETLKSRAQVQREKLRTAEVMSQSLIDRSAVILSKMRNKVPSITKAEEEYFDQIKRCDAQCSKWVSFLEQIETLYTDIQQRIDNIAYKISLSPEQYTACLDLLDGSNVLLQRNASILKDCKDTITAMSSESGAA